MFFVSYTLVSDVNSTWTLQCNDFVVQGKRLPTFADAPIHVHSAALLKELHADYTAEGLEDFSEGVLALTTSDLADEESFRIKPLTPHLTESRDWVHIVVRNC